MYLAQLVEAEKLRQRDSLSDDDIDRDGISPSQRDIFAVYVAHLANTKVFDRAIDALVSGMRMSDVMKNILQIKTPFHRALLIRDLAVFMPNWVPQSAAHLFPLSPAAIFKSCENI